MKLNLVLQKRRFDYLIKEFTDRIEVTKESTDENNTDWVFFDIEILYPIDLLNIFHAGVSIGLDDMKKAYVKY
jgi:hypothetical protein